MWVRSLGQEDALEEGMATHSSILAWRSSWTEKPGGLQSVGSQRVRHDWSNWACTHAHVMIYRSPMISHLVSITTEGRFLFPSYLWGDRTPELAVNNLQNTIGSLMSLPINLLPPIPICSLTLPFLKGVSRDHEPFLCFRSWWCELGQTSGDGEGQRGPACWSP